MGQGKETITAGGRQAGIRAFLLSLAVDDVAGKVFCLFSQSQVVEILGLRPIQRIPFSPAYLEGVINYFDQLLPVINLDKLCNRTANHKDEGHRQLMVIRTGSVDPTSGEPLKVVIAARTKVRLAKLSAQLLTAPCTGREAPLSLKNTGILRGYFPQDSGGIALIDLSRVALGTLSEVVVAEGKQVD